ncbi:hypothetical protein HU200_008922 [Digitaria exilis]|uniref:DUF1618 domain-containing protein n=1 Tax=Digitaria exilis TaxID=1010633 RepID=A0A835FL87_9POAL|nr:hypothetical protein HU200_008922 [Digitaria exilis]
MRYKERGGGHGSTHEVELTLRRREVPPRRPPPSLAKAGGDRRAEEIYYAGLPHLLRPSLRIYSDRRCPWTSTVLCVHDPVRDIVLPIPDTATELIYHNTDKVITIGGPRVTILLCDVLDHQEELMLRDVPLPKPSRANRRSFCIGGPRPARDIAVVTTSPVNKVIKYIEMEIRPGEDLPPPRHQSACGSHSDDDAPSPPRVRVAPYWKATIWTMPLPLGSWKDWHKDGKVDVTDILAKDQNQREQLMLLPQLTTTDDPQNLTMRLRRLHAAHPTLGLGDHGDDLVIYFLSKAHIMDDKGWVMAVGAMDKMLRGIAELDSRKHKHWRCCYMSTDIFKHLIKATAAEEMEDDSDQPQQQEDAAKELEPRNVCTSLKFGSFSWEMIPVGLRRCDEVVKVEVEHTGGSSGAGIVVDV